MKFTNLEPLNQRFNEELKKHGLTKIYENSNIPRDIKKHFNDNHDLVERIFDETNETFSQIFIRTKNGIRYGLVFIGTEDTEVPNYDNVYVVRGE